MLDEKERLLALRMESEKQAAARAAASSQEDSPSRSERSLLTRGRSFSESGVDALALAGFPASALVPPPLDPPGRRRSSGVSHKQQLAQMQQQLQLQQAHMLQLHQMHAKAQQEQQEQKQQQQQKQQEQQQQQNNTSPPLPSHSSLRATAFKKHYSGKIKPSSGVRVRRKSLGSGAGEFDFSLGTDTSRPGSSCGSTAAPGVGR